MKARLLIPFLLITLTATWAQEKDFYTIHWNKVYRNELEGLPKSALAVVDTIYSKAKGDNNLQELTKALIYQSKFAISTQENSELSIIDKFNREIRDSKPPLTNVLESMVANIYWQYLKENRWKYYQRSNISQGAGSQDFRTWDAKTMFDTIHLHFQNSLEDAIRLQNIPLESINSILVQAENSKKYRPTLYDFLCHNAIDFYSTDESSVTKPSGQFKIENENYFLDFESIEIHKSDTLSPVLQALSLYQDLLAFHKKRRDTTAYVNLEIERLNLITDENILDDSDTLRIKALTALRNTYRSHPASTLPIFEIAAANYGEGRYPFPTSGRIAPTRLVEALNLCNEAISLFPKSYGAEKCEELKERILARELSLVAEGFIPADKPSLISITYANVDSVYLKVCPISTDLFNQLSRNAGDSLAWVEVAGLDSILKLSTPLINVHDYQSHTTEVSLPPLTNGKYIILASPDDKYIYNVDYFGYALIQVTDLALLQYNSDDAHHYRVVNRNNGAPVQGAEIHLQGRQGGDDQQFNERVTTGKDGEATIKKGSQHVYQLTADVTFGDDHAVFGNYYMYAATRNSGIDETITARVFLFTDRSIYRPGQTVFFKGILVKSEGDKSAVVPAQFITVTLKDVNGDEVSTLRLKTNSFGSVSGEFRLPSSGLTGEYTLVADEDDEGESKFYDNLDDFEYSEQTISVEEYKRPTFEVTFEPVTQVFTLTDTVRLTGTADAFSGSAIAGSQVVYRVSRKIRYPKWHNWYYDQGSSDAAEIAHGQTKTTDAGKFNITFAAIPDSKVAEEEKPVFVYEIKVDVTDITGETRSATTTVKVGYQSVTATINAPAQLDTRKPGNTISITTENLNGQFVPLKGKVQIFKLKAPDKPTRPRPWGAPDLPLLTEAQFRELFPHDSYTDNADPNKWPKEKLLVELPFNTGLSKELKYEIDEKWPLGHYSIELTAFDSTGQTVNDYFYFDVTDSRSSTVPDNALVIFELDKPAYKVGEVARLKIGSASPDITLFIHVEKDYETTKTYTEHFSANTRTIHIPVTAAREHGFSISCSGAAYNSFVYKTINVPVIAPVQQIEIETITFKDKLQTGSKQTWSFAINGADSQAKEAEVVASMYDASLDQFKSHRWYFNPNSSSSYFARIFINGEQSFSETNFHFKNQPPGFIRKPGQYYDEFDWYGFSFNKNSYLQRRYLDRLYSSGIALDEPSRTRARNSQGGKTGFIYGRIVDNDGQPLPGVNVVIKGTTVGTATDMDGNYVIKAEKRDVLVYSFIGFASAEARVGRKNTIDVVMEPDIMELSEVVVTAYGVQTKKEALALAASAVVIEDSSEVVFGEALLGTTAGVQVLSRGKFYAMSIRGYSAISADARPLYVVDGVVVDAEELDATELADVQVLKGSAATALYGARAANGVIIVMTKAGQKKIDEELASVRARTNFNETAFFFPHLSTNENGNVQFTFTTPEALTRWKLQLLAHTRDLRTTSKTLMAVTQKELMITPNVPRFLRVGDELIFSAKIANLSKRKLSGKVALMLTDAVTGKNVDGLLGNTVRNKSFAISASGSTDVSWTLRVPEGVGALQYKVVAKAGNFSDGEQNALPVLPNRTLVTETMPMFVRQSSTKTFVLDKLQHFASATAQHHRLTLEVTSNPAWYAVQSLPYLMEFPHECSEQLFARYFANALGSHIIDANPTIREVFKQWSSYGELVSNLEKNPELKSLVVEETPWLRDARDENEQRKALSLLFELNKMKEQMTTVVSKLKEMQFASGSFPWFAGGRYPNRYITQHIAATYGHLKKLGVPDYSDEKNMVLKAINFLDLELTKEYETLMTAASQAGAKGTSSDEKTRLRTTYLSTRHVSDYTIHYLYMRSFFPEVQPQEKLKEAIDYYQKQSSEFWQDFNLYSKGMIALIHHRHGNTSLALDILKSLNENAINSEELGMYWKENNGGMDWNDGAIETQSLLIEAFAEIDPEGQISDAEGRNVVDELRLWLLKNKQTTQWKTTKATTEAVYALLMRGTDWLSLDNQVDVSVGSINVSQSAQNNPEIATGYFKTSWSGESITPDMATVTFTKEGDGVAWGGLYWQYFQDLDKVTSAETPLKLTRRIFLVTNTDHGERLSNVRDNLKPGDRLRVRIELTADRPMEFLHMKDMRAAGFEPIDVLSGYKWQENLGYYQSTRDASTNFFFEFVPKGVYVFEYDLRVNNKGDFSNGITTIQSMYAPEFSSHSEGVRVRVK